MTTNTWTSRQAALNDKHNYPGAFAVAPVTSDAGKWIIISKVGEEFYIHTSDSTTLVDEGEGVRCFSSLYNQRLTGKVDPSQYVETTKLVPIV